MLLWFRKAQDYSNNIMYCLQSGHLGAAMGCRQHKLLWGASLLCRSLSESRHLWNNGARPKCLSIRFCLRSHSSAMPSIRLCLSLFVLWFCSLCTDCFLSSFVGVCTYAFFYFSSCFIRDAFLHVNSSSCYLYNYFNAEFVCVVLGS